MTAPQAGLAATLAAGLESIGLRLDPGQQRQLLRHLALIEQWNRVYNLTAVRKPEQMLVQHLLDSLAVVEPLRRKLAAVHGPIKLLDVGSGAGLPGIAFAIACPDLVVTCIDAVGKKAGFIRQAGGELGLPNLVAVHGRVEELDAAPWRVIACRAFSALPDFTKRTSPLLAEGGFWMAMKGKVPENEIVALPEHIEAFHVEPIGVPTLHAERCVVWMRKVCRVTGS